MLSVHHPLGCCVGHGLKPLTRALTAKLERARPRTPCGGGGGGGVLVALERMPKGPWNMLFHYWRVHLVVDNTHKGWPSWPARLLVNLFVRSDSELPVVPCAPGECASSRGCPLCLCAHSSRARPTWAKHGHGGCPPKQTTTALQSSTLLTAVHSQAQQYGCEKLKYAL